VFLSSNGAAPGFCYLFFDQSHMDLAQKTLRHGVAPAFFPDFSGF